MEDEKIVYKLKKELLSSEIEEKRKKRVHTILTIILCVCFMGLGLFVGLAASSTSQQEVSQPPKTNDISRKWNELTSYMKSYWLYGPEYDDLGEFLEDNAFYGMINFEFDPYTIYMSSEEYDYFASSINMDFVGIGITYMQIDNVATITRVYRNSPAEQAGLQAGDMVRFIDDIDVTGYTNDEIQELALGDEGSHVEVTVERDGELLTFDIIRSALDATVYAYTQDDYVVLDIDSFGDYTYYDCVDYLEEYRDYSKIIIDLRDNGGGYQTSVQQVAELFLGPDVLVMTQEYKTGRVEEFMTMGNDYYPNFEKMVVLINEQTASAAEVLAMALKEQHPNATLMGTTSYGKGVVQSSLMLRDGSVLKVTTSKWLSPQGVWIDYVGIKPDIEVFLGDIMYETYYLMDEDEEYKFDSVSGFVQIASEALDFLGYSVNRTDGYFDRSIERAIINFQASKGFPETGALDAQTYESLITNVLKEWAMNPEKDVQMLRAIEFINED